MKLILHVTITVDPIYSQIDRVLGNVDWFQTCPNVQVEVMEASVSDHALLQIRVYEPAVRRKRQFKFINSVFHKANFL